MHCARQMIILNREFGRQLGWCTETGVQSKRVVAEAMQLTYDYCLGFSKLAIYVPRAPSNFKDAIFEEEFENRPWVVRHLSLLPDCWRYPRISMFTDLAIYKNGHEWDMRDLRRIIESLEEVVGKPRQQHG